jgi:hypothetical protein
MTDDKIALRVLLEKGSDATFLREMIGFAAESHGMTPYDHAADELPTAASSPGIGVRNSWWRDERTGRNTSINDRAPLSSSSSPT